MKGGRFSLVRTTAWFSTRHRPCERECAAEYGEYTHTTQSYRLVTDVHASSSGRPQSVQPRRLGYAVRDAILGHFFLSLLQRDWRRCRGDLMRKRFIPAFRLDHVEAFTEIAQDHG